MGDVPERPRMDESRRPLQGLQQVRANRVFEKGSHGACALEILRCDRLPVSSQAYQNATEALAKVSRIRREGQDRHDL